VALLGDALLLSGEQSYENATVARAIGRILKERVQRQLSGVTGVSPHRSTSSSSSVAPGAMPLSPGGRISVQSPSAEGAAGLGETSQVRLLPPFRAKPYPAPGFSTEAVQTPARVNVTCVTPLGEEVASTS
jgi:hypothetical protein